MTELQALRLSIRKWVVRVWRPLRRGREIRRHTDGLYWADTHEKVPCYADTCPLCAECWDMCKRWKRGKVDKIAAYKICPLFMFQMSPCDGSTKTAWLRFIKEPTADNAKEMIQTLVDTYWWQHVLDLFDKKDIIALGRFTDSDRNKEDKSTKFVSDEQEELPFDNKQKGMQF